MTQCGKSKDGMNLWTASSMNHLLTSFGIPRSAPSRSGDTLPPPVLDRMRGESMSVYVWISAYIGKPLGLVSDAPHGHPETEETEDHTTRGAPHHTATLSRAHCALHSILQHGWNADISPMAIDCSSLRFSAENAAKTSRPPLLVRMHFNPSRAQCVEIEVGDEHFGRLLH